MASSSVDSSTKKTTTNAPKSVNLPTLAPMVITPANDNKDTSSNGTTSGADDINTTVDSVTVKPIVNGSQDSETGRQPVLGTLQGGATQLESTKILTSENMSGNVSTSLQP